MYSKSQAGNILPVVVDLALLYGLLIWTQLPYPISIALAFLAGTTLNFFIQREFIFGKSSDDKRQEYSRFFIVALGVLAFAVGGTAFLVEQIGFAPFPARVIVGILAGIVGFLGHAIITFRSLR